MIRYIQIEYNYHCLRTTWITFAQCSLNCMNQRLPTTREVGERRPADIPHFMHIGTLREVISTSATQVTQETHHRTKEWFQK